MNYRLVSKYLGQFIIIFSFLTLPSLLCALIYGETSMVYTFLNTIIVACLIGGALALFGKNATFKFYQREALGLVALGWLLSAIIGALPFYFSGAFSMVDSIFESMSGLTTTGATIMEDIESHPKSLLFWRSFSQWLGGMGIILLFIAVLPYLGAGGKQLFRSEVTGPDPRGLSPRIKDTASFLYKIYFGMTIILVLLLMFAGMDLYDALCHTFTTLSTGGFSPRQDSIAYYDSAIIETIIIVFMILAGTNFALYVTILRGKKFIFFRDTEWRTYLLVLTVATLLVAANLQGAQKQLVLSTSPPETPEYTAVETMRASAFQVVSIMTSTGYATEDFDVWPYFSRVLLLLLMFIGGNAGSTAGGLKVIRWVILAKMVYWRIESTFRPKTVRAIRVNGQVIEEDIQQMIYAFFALNMVVFSSGTLIMTFFGLPIESAASSVAATLNNIGPGFEHVGPVESFAFIPDIGKLFLALFMMMGRLEMFTVCVLFVPAFWRHA